MQARAVHRYDDGMVCSWERVVAGLILVLLLQWVLAGLLAARQLPLPSELIANGQAEPVHVSALVSATWRAALLPLARDGQQHQLDELLAGLRSLQIQPSSHDHLDLVDDGSYALLQTILAAPTWTSDARQRELTLATQTSVSNIMDLVASAQRFRGKRDNAAIVVVLLCLLPCCLAPALHLLASFCRL